MCGIAGWLASDPRAPVERTTVERMLATLVHRGPDGEGVFTEPGIGLGTRRLAIVDLEHGAQPLANEDGSVVVVCNGEIYDAPETRARLTAAGHVLRTRSDVEVIPHLYEQHGLGFVHHLRGMFALALWDARRRRLVLARDRFAMKPLCWREDARGLAFASEAKAILAATGEGARIDPAALRDVLELGFARTPRTLFAGIRALPGSHLLVHENGRTRVERWWEPPFRPRGEPEPRRSDDDWIAALRDKLAEAVRIHMRGDVEPGVMLSGGLDSSAVAALMCGLAGTPVRSYSIGFDAGAIDEPGRRRMLYDFPGLALDARTTRATAASLEALPWSVWSLEDPGGAGSACWRLPLAEMASREVKVVLTGEGSDEVFGGYPWYHGQKLLGPIARLPLAARRVLALGPVLPRLRPGLARLLLAPPEMGLARFGAMMGARELPALRPLLAPDLLHEIDRASDPPGRELDVPDAFASWHPMDQLHWVDMRVRLADAINTGLDRETMAYSLEARLPFLDHELVELVCALPRRLRMRGLTEKFALREAVRGVMPDEIRTRPKLGTQSPIGEWLRGRELPSAIAHALSPDALAASGWFAPSAVRDLLARHRAGAAGGERTLLTIAALQTWHDVFVSRRLVPERATWA